MVREAHVQKLPLPRRRVRTAGYLLGASLAGVFDALVLQPAGLGWTALALGLWLLLPVAVGMLWRARARFAEPGAGRILAGSALVGAGILEAVAVVVVPGVGATWRLVGAAIALAAALLGLQSLASAARTRRAARARPGRSL